MSRTSWYALRMLLSRADASMARWSNHAPLGRPVVPLVHTMQTGSPGSRRGRSVSAVPAVHAAATSARGIMHLGRGRAAGNRERVALVQQRDRLTPLQDRGDLAGPRRVLMPVATAPRRVHAAYATA